MRNGILPALNPKVESVAPYLLLAGAVFVAYANVYGNGFVGDDDILIAHNPLLRSWHYLPVVFTRTLAPGCPYFRPLHGLLDMAVYQAAGLSLFAFHLVNVVLHAANACLVYKLGRKLAFALLPAFLAALLWALHPLHTEAVTQMSGAADVLYSFFCLLGVLVLFPDFTRRKFFLAALFMILALLSKEAAIVFPLLALSCLVYAQNDKRFNVRTWLRIWPLAVAAFVYVIVWLVVLYSIFKPVYASAASAQPHGFNYVLFATPYYFLRLMLWPVDLYMGHDLKFYPTPRHRDVVAGMAITLLAAIQILRPQSRRSLPFSWGMCWFIGAQIPTFISSSILYEHWVYLPSAGLVLGGFESVWRWAKDLPARTRAWTVRAGVAVALIAAPVLGVLTLRQNEVWRQSEVFYENIIAHPGSHLTTRMALGILYAHRAEYEKAIEQFRLVSENPESAALSLDQMAQLQAMWGTVLLALPGDDGEALQEEALAHLHRAVELDPDSVLALNSLAHISMERNDVRAAVTYRDKADAARKKSPWPDYVFDTQKE